MIRKHFVLGFFANLRANWWRFARRWVFVYAAAGLALWFAISWQFGYERTVLSAAWLVLLAILLGALVTLITSFLQGRKPVLLDATFSEASVLLELEDELNEQPVGWDWVSSARETSDKFVLRVGAKAADWRPYRRLELNLPKKDFHPSELAIFKLWLELNGKLS